MVSMTDEGWKVHDVPLTGKLHSDGVPIAGSKQEYGSEAGLFRGGDASEAIAMEDTDGEVAGWLWSREGKKGKAWVKR